MANELREDVVEQLVETSWIAANWAARRVSELQATPAEVAEASTRFTQRFAQDTHDATTAALAAGADRRDRLEDADGR